MRNLSVLAVLLLMFSCNKKFPYEEGTFPEEKVVNLVELNSEFDDMNSDYNPPSVDLNLNFIFSSNSESKGQNFDLVAKSLSFNWSKETGNFTYSGNSLNGGNQSLRNQLFEINSACNERGPYSFRERNSQKNYLLFSAECDGITHIVGNEFELVGPWNAYKSDNFQVRLLCQDANEMYPTLYGENYVKDVVDTQGKPEKLLFSSNRDGLFNIYEATIPAGKSVIEFLKSQGEKSITKLPISSSSNDHMPFVYGNLLVFASDRVGGFGGYDLYYSRKSGSEWSEPVNFGPSINSPQDEYRPVVSSQFGFSNQVMIFSSNRPGGLGGFDLYFVGIPKY